MLLCRSEGTVTFLQDYYSACRSNETQGQGLSTILVTLLRLCFASARLHLRESCDIIDCLLAVRLVEETRKFQQGITVLDVEDLNQAPLADASGDENTFGEYLEDLRSKYAAHTCQHEQ